MVIGRWAPAGVLATKSNAPKILIDVVFAEAGTRVTGTIARSHSVVIGSTPGREGSIISPADIVVVP